MDASASASPSSPNVAPVSESYFECPRCHRQCKSRTWFLKHLEGCFKGPGASHSPTPASGEVGAGPSPAQQYQPQSTRAGRSGVTITAPVDDLVSSPVFESVGTSSLTSSVYSHQEVQSRKTSRLQLGVGGGEAGTDAALDLSDSNVSPRAASSRAAAMAFSFKRSPGGEGSRSGHHAKSSYSNLDEQTARVLANGSGGADGAASGGSGPPVFSQRASMSQGSSSYVGSPLGVRAATSYGESASAGASNQRQHNAAAAGASTITGGADFAPEQHLPEIVSTEEATPRQPPVRQGSFRLHSDATWTQFTPTTSASDSEDDNEDSAGGGGGAGRSSSGAANGGDSFLAHSNRPPSQGPGRSAGQQQHQHHQHHHHSDNVHHRRSKRHPNARDLANLSFSAGSRLVSPSGHDVLSVPWVYERNGSVGSSRNEATAAAAAAVAANNNNASQGRHASLSFPASSPSLPREPERVVPRLVMGSSLAAGDHTPLDRKGSGVGFGSGTDGVYGGADRLSRSAHGSASPGTLSRMSSSASPMFAQAMASPMVGHISPSMPPGASGSRHAAFPSVSNNASGVIMGQSGGRTPRHSDRSGAATPRAISFQRGGAVGSGGFGTVYQAILSDGSLAAVKELKLENTNLKAIDREVRAMSGIPPHPNCVRYLGSRYSAHHYYIIMEYISGGSINSLRKSVGRFRESVFQRYAYMVLLGLAHLHAHGIVHRDIKGANVLLDESGCAKIVDFGCSRDVNQATTTLSGGGTPLWMAPEVCRGEPATEKSDVWAFGCLCLEMTNDTGLPWSFPANITLQGVVYALACAKASPPIPDKLSPEAQDFLRQCLRVDPEERATVAELLQHPFFDVDLMGDSDEDEMLSSCPQSAVKRAAQQVRQSHVRDARAAVVPSSTADNNNSFSGGDDGRGSPLLSGGSGGVRSPRASQLEPQNYPSNGDLVVVSQSSHSKSPSGPRLDHYPRSVNMGFSLQAVDDEDEEEDGGGGDRGRPIDCAPQPTNANAAMMAEEPSAFGVNSGHYTDDVDGPPAIPSTSVPGHRIQTPSMGSQAIGDGDGEDEDEYTQMITEIITQAREAYTDEERRMTERRRQRHNLYPSSDDDDDGSFSDSSGDTSAGAVMINRARGGPPPPPSSSSSDTSSDGNRSSDESSVEDGSGGPQRHKLGATWRAARSSSSSATHATGLQAHDGGRQSSSSSQPYQQGNGGRAAAAATASGGGAVKRRDSEWASEHGTTVSRRDHAMSSSTRTAGTGHALPTALSSDPLNHSLSSRSATPSASLVGGPQSSPQQQQQQQSPLPTAALPTASHRPPPRHQTPTSPPPPSSVFREAAPRESVRDIRPLTNTATPPQVVAAASSGTPLAPSEPGGPGRTVSAAHPNLRLSPGFLPLSAASKATSPHLNNAANTNASTEDSSGARTPRQAPALTVGGPSGQTPQGGSRSSAEASLRHSPNGSAVEWYTGASGRLERNVTWQTGASGEQPKELSMAQKEMQDMLDWGRASGRQTPSVTSASSSSPLAVARHSSKEASSSEAGNGSHRHGQSHKHREEEKQRPRSPFAAEASKGVTAPEKVEGKRRHLGLGIFRRRKSK